MDNAPVNVQLKHIQIFLQETVKIVLKIVYSVKIAMNVFNVIMDFILMKNHVYKAVHNINTKLILLVKIV